MPLKAKVANKVQTNKSGLIEGTIIEVLETDERTEIERGKEVKYQSQFEFVIEVPGSQKPVNYRIWTGKIFNDEKSSQKRDNDYNDLTRLMLQLEVLAEKELKALESLNDFDVSCVEGLKIQFELEPSKKQNGLKVPKITSIKPLKVN